MIHKIRGKLAKKDEEKVILEVSGIFYEISVPKTVSSRLRENIDEEVELVIFDYIAIDKNKGTPFLVGFFEELEKDFFEKFIGVSGVGPRAALRAFDKPVSRIAQAIEEADIDFLKTLAGIGKQRAKQIIAHLQGKVGRFALIKAKETSIGPIKKEIIEEAKKVLKRLQYAKREIEDMLKVALRANPEPEKVEDLLNEIYRQRKVN